MKSSLPHSILAFAFAFSFSACSSAPTSPWEKSLDEPNIVEGDTQAMDTPFHIRVWLANGSAAEKEKAHKAIGIAKRVIQQVGKIADEDRPDSEISKINSSHAGKAMAVSQHLMYMIMIGEKMWEKSNGAFDITFLPIQKEYVDKFGENAGLHGGIGEFDNMTSRSTRNKVGQRNLLLDPKGKRIQFRKDGMKLGVKGIAKGYAVHWASKQLATLKLEGFTVAGGGVIAAWGKALQDPQVLCVENPQDLGNCLYHVKPKSNQRIFTLGRTANFDRPGQVYHPQAGERVVGSGAVTLAGPNGAWVQAAATTLTVLGPLEAPAFFDKLQDPILSGVYFADEENPELSGTLEPWATLTAVPSEN